MMRPIRALTWEILARHRWLVGGSAVWLVVACLIVAVLPVSRSPQVGTLLLMPSIIGVMAFLIVWNSTVRPAGVVFVGTIAAYTLGRQLLFPLRDLPRKPGHGRILATWIAGSVLIIDAVVAALG